MKNDKIMAIFNDYQRALNRLSEGLEKDPDNDIVIDGTILRFEFTFELSWKLLKSFLQYEGIECNSPRNAIKEACAFGLIQDGDEWIDMLEDRNKTSHIYDETAAGDI